MLASTQPDLTQPLPNVASQEAKADVAQEMSPKASEDKAQIKALLSEARQTREMLLDFQKAIENGSFQGYQMLGVAKGIAFLQAIANQNKAHIDNLQERLK